MDDIQEEVRRLRTVLRQRSVTQEALAIDLKVSQSQISRVLAGRLKRRTELLRNLSGYVDRLVSGKTTSVVRKNELLMRALMETWDGSEAHAQALAIVIRSLRALGPAR